MEYDFHVQEWLISHPLPRIGLYRVHLEQEFFKHDFIANSKFNLNKFQITSLNYVVRPIHVVAI